MRSCQHQGHRVQSPSSADDNLARTTSHVVSLPPPYIVIFGCSPQYQRGGGIRRRIQRRLTWRLQHHFLCQRPLRIRHRPQPHPCTGGRHRPRAPSPLDEVLPSLPIPPLGGGFKSRAVNNQQTVRRCHWPRHRHGRPNNLARPTQLVTRLFPPTLIQRWGGLQRRL